MGAPGIQPPKRAIAAATQSGILQPDWNASLTAIIIISMALAPLTMLLFRRFGPRGEQVSMEGVELADGLHGSVLVIGFGRFGQIAAQPLLLRGVDVSIIDKSVSPGDDFYEMLIETHRGLSDEDSRLVNARLVLLLANHVGDLDVLREALQAARAGIGATP